MSRLRNVSELQNILQRWTNDPYTQLPRGVFVATSSKGTLFEGAHGWHTVPDDPKDLPAASRVSLDSRFELWSMTKLIAAIAALQLLEQGRLQWLDDARSLVPELARVRFFKGYDAQDEPILEESDRKITIRDLLVHTSGLSYDDNDRYPGFNDRYVPEVLGYSQLTDPFLKYDIEELIKFPLLCEPGSRFEYGWSYDWLTLVIERVTGRTIDEYVQQHILHPLKIFDTTWQPRDDKVNVAMMDEKHRPEVRTTYAAPLHLTQKHHFGGAGLSGSARSYARVLQMLLRKGELDGVRILTRESVESMFTPQLTETERQGLVAFPIDAQNGFVATDERADVGQQFGIGGLLVGAGSAGPRRRSEGSLTWDGICCTYFLVDPKKDVAFAFFVNAFPWKARKVLDCFAELEEALYQELE